MGRSAGGTPPHRPEPTERRTLNFLAHSITAERVGLGSPRPVLGAALSDLSAMAGLRFEVADLHEEIALGVRCHWATDRVFHADPAFVAGIKHLRSAAEAAGLAPGASRALAHAGWELLLDGVLAARPGAADPLLGALAGAAAASDAFGPERRGPWERLVRRLLGDRLWTRYEDPAFVAERLFAMLARRPRLAFPPDAIGAATGVLTEARPDVAGVADAVLDRVVARLGSDARWRAPAR
jgi:hypothetical protein